MLNNWIITIVALVVVLGLITYLTSQKNKKQVTKNLNSEFPEPEFIEEEKETE